MQQQMIQLIYLSFFSHHLSSEALEEILTASRRNNEQLGVTGLLIVKGDSFLQALEGEKETVYALYEKIKHDKRHRDVMKVSEETIEQRAFANWSMGFKNLNDFSPIESEKLVNLDKIDLKDASFSEKRSEIHELFQHFVKIDKNMSLL